LYHVGIYDYEKLLTSNWATYLDFVLKLYRVVPSTYTIGDAKMQGKFNGEPVYVWDYPDDTTAVVNEKTFDTFIDILRGHEASVVHYIVPSAALRFIGSEYTKGKTTLKIERVPNSVFWNLEKRKDGKAAANFSSMTQAMQEKDVNNSVDSFGYDFMQAPLVDYTSYKRQDKEGMFTSESYVIDIETFKPRGFHYAPDDFENFEKLSLILIDFNYKKEAESDTMPACAISSTKTNQIHARQPRMCGAR
jgi:hypothetical protein